MRRAKYIVVSANTIILTLMIVLLMSDVREAFYGIATAPQTIMLLHLALLIIGTAYLIFIQFKHISNRANYRSAISGAQEARELAEQSARSKSDFLARMSHEIRTPMNGVLGMAESLSFTALDKEQKDLLQTLNGSARNLLALLNDVLDFSKLEADKMELEHTNFDIEKLLAGVHDNFRHKALSKGVDFVYDIDPSIRHQYYGDPTRLMQVLNNIVSNAIKFTSKGFIHIGVELLDTEVVAANDRKGSAHLLQFYVRDSGIGINESKQSTLFQAFTQADSNTTRRFGGTGLGLSICKDIIDLMQGEIEIDSVPGIGSNFSIQLRLLPSDLNDQTKVVSPSLSGSGNCCSVENLHQVSILVAEDNDVNVKVICQQLKQLGMQPDIARDGLQAEQMANQNHYDVVLSDCHMPNMDGFELAKRLSARRTGKSPYLIAITADAVSGAVQHCLDSGFDDYLSKPCPIEQLKAKLSDARQLLLQHGELTLPESTSQATAFAVDVEVLQPESQRSTELEWLPQGVNEPQDKESGLRAPVIDAINKKQQPSHGSVSGLLNREQIIEFSGGELTIVGDILEAYLSSSADDRQALHQSFEQGQFSQLKDITHRIKGTVGYLGATALRQMAKEIEQLALAEELFKLQPLVIDFLLKLVLLESEVKCWLDEMLEQNVA